MIHGKRRKQIRPLVESPEEFDPGLADEDERGGEKANGVSGI